MKLLFAFNFIFIPFTALKGHDEVLTKRARHVITEIQRTSDAADALKKKDFVKVNGAIVDTLSRRWNKFRKQIISPFCAKKTMFFFVLYDTIAFLEYDFIQAHNEMLFVMNFSRSFNIACFIFSILFFVSFLFCPFIRFAFRWDA